MNFARYSLKDCMKFRNVILKVLEITNGRCKMAVLYKRFPGFLKGWKVVRLVPTPLKLTGQAVRKPDFRLLEEVLTNEVTASWRKYMASCGNLCYIPSYCTSWKLIQNVFTPSKWSSYHVIDRLYPSPFCIQFWILLILLSCDFIILSYVHSFDCLIFPRTRRQTYGLGLVVFPLTLAPALECLLWILDFGFFLFTNY